MNNSPVSAVRARGQDCRHDAGVYRRLFLPSRDRALSTAESPSSVAIKRVAANHCGLEPGGRIGVYVGGAEIPVVSATKLGVVQHVHRIRADLQAETFAKTEAALQSHVDIESAWRTDVVVNRSAGPIPKLVHYPPAVRRLDDTALKSA